MRYWLLAATGLLVMAPAPAFAEIHTLDFSGNACDSTSDPGPCFAALTDTTISQHYGDDATINISYRAVSATTGTTTLPFLIWRSGAGDLTDVAEGGLSDTDLGEIRFAPADGYEVSLISFDIACLRSAVCSAFEYDVLTPRLDLITNGTGTIPSGASHISFQPDTDYFDEPILLRWTPSEGVGIDNIVFDVRQVAAPTAVPEPAAWAMMLGGFGLIGTAMRRRQPVALA